MPLTAEERAENLRRVQLAQQAALAKRFGTAKPGASENKKRPIDKVSCFSMASKAYIATIIDF